MIYQKGPLVYLTTAKEFALDAFEIYALNYLLKPLEKERFFEVLDRVTRQLMERVRKTVSVKTKEGVRQLLLDDIVYTELVRRCCCYHLKDGSTVVANQQRVSFAEIMQPLLQDEMFCRCGASFVINLYYVKMVNKDRVQFRNDKELMLPKSAHGTVLAAWFDYWMRGAAGDE